MPVKLVKNGDLVRSIVAGIVFLLVYIGIVPVDVKDVLAENLEAAGIAVVGLISIIGTIVSLFRKVPAGDAPGA